MGDVVAFPGARQPEEPERSVTEHPVEFEEFVAGPVAAFMGDVAALEDVLDDEDAFRAEWTRLRDTMVALTPDG